MKNGYTLILWIGLFCFSCTRDQKIVVLQDYFASICNGGQTTEELIRDYYTDAELVFDAPKENLIGGINQAWCELRQSEEYAMEIIPYGSLEQENQQEWDFEERTEDIYMVFFVAPDTTIRYPILLRE